MRDYAKVGGKIGKPGYRTPASFREKVFAVVAKIPKGKTLTYLEVAQKAGNPKACRAVGSVLSRNFDPRIPCHRVVKSDGSLGGYNRGIKKKRKLLKQEKVDFKAQS